MQSRLENLELLSDGIVVGFVLICLYFTAHGYLENLGHCNYYGESFIAQGCQNKLSADVLPILDTLTLPLAAILFIPILLLEAIFGLGFVYALLFIAAIAILTSISIKARFKPRVQISFIGKVRMVFLVASLPCLYFAAVQISHL